ncbi:MAG: PSD1 and planctomycete cytochrome C domain-containing protein [Pirellulaceae bacterium]
MSASQIDAVESQPRPVRFNRDIRAILSDKCFACHGPDAKTVEGDLRLDDRENAIDRGAITPGKPDESELLARIFSDDESMVMPPPKAHKSLEPGERELLRRWVAEGAQYEPHWAYTAIRPADTASQPEGSAKDHIVDRFIDARLQAEGITPVEQADRVTLIRRLSFDLNGLPPSLEEVNAFINDTSEQAYTKLVERLLESNRFGERMAMYWLDLVRYADTVGYHGDQNVSQSPYRDYVIDAFNDNMPYDRFIREQLAGDLLPDATLEQRVASGYNRLNQTTEEGGSQAKEYLAIYFADRVRNLSQVFMGATMGCAQCHDHKYDPYTMKDFYSIGAFFADLEERGVYGARSRPPMIPVPTEAELKAIEEIDSQIAEANQRREPLKQELLKAQPAWEVSTLETLDASKEVVHSWLDDVQDTGGNTSGTFDFIGADQGPVHSGQKSRRQRAGGLIQHFFDDAKTKVRGEEGLRFFVWAFLDPENPPKAIMLQLNDGGWDHRAVWGSDDIGYGLRKENWAGYQRQGNLPEVGKWIRLEVDAASLGITKEQQVDGMAFTQFGGTVYWDQAGWISQQGIPESVVEALKVAAESRTEQQAEAVSAHYLAHAQPMVDLQKRIDQLAKQRQNLEDKMTQTVVSRSVSPREIRILPRGNWMDDSGEIVQPAIPEFLGRLEIGDRRATRLDLAEWLCRDDNPLTSRTMVNRLWSLMFGRGICASVDDFGGQGTYPSYPDLLDALASDFIKSGWDIKHVIRQIVHSDAYKRSSRPTDELRQVDPYNDLFARQGRYRLDAEMVRDAALKTSGLLVERIGGPSVHPYQPAGYYAQLNFPRREYQPDHDENQYRRGLYTHWQRTFLHPMLKAFDAPSREECTAQRSRSNTPLQSLTLLNDPTFVEAARVFAQRIATEGGETTDEKLEWAYRSAVSQTPSVEIKDELRKVYETHLSHYQSNLDAAKELIAVGEATVQAEIDPAVHAAWTSVARVILNLHEGIMRY